MIASYGVTKKTKNDTIVPMQTLLGIDPGNGFIKAITDNGERVVLPSIISEPKEYFDGGIVASNGVSVLYVAGARADLINKKFLVGDIAHSANPLNHISIASHPQAKADYALELILGAVGLMPQCDRLITPVISVHDSVTFGNRIKQQVEGMHRVQFDGKELNIEISSPAISPEGMGIYYYLLTTGKVKSSDLVLLLDLGLGTSIYTAFQSTKILERSVFRWGVRDLYGYICQSPKLRDALKGMEGDSQVVRAAIENKTFAYRTEDGIFDFKWQYTEALKTWLQNNITKAYDQIRPRISKATHLFLAGGGANLPNVATTFTKKGFEILNNGQFCNAEGLLAIAKARRTTNG